MRSRIADGVDDVPLLEVHAARDVIELAGHPGTQHRNVRLTSARARAPRRGSAGARRAPRCPARTGRRSTSWTRASSSLPTSMRRSAFTASCLPSRVRATISSVRTTGGGGTVDAARLEAQLAASRARGRTDRGMRLAREAAVGLDAALVDLRGDGADVRRRVDEPVRVVEQRELVERRPSTRRGRRVARDAQDVVVALPRERLQVDLERVTGWAWRAPQRGGSRRRQRVRRLARAASPRRRAGRSGAPTSWMRAPVSLPGLHVPRAHVEDAVGVDLEGHGNLRLAPRAPRARPDSSSSPRNVFSAKRLLSPCATRT